MVLLEGPCENDVILITTYYLLWNDWKFLYHKPFLKNYGKKIKEEKPYLKNIFFFDTFLFWLGEIWSWMSMLKISKSVYQLSLHSLLLRIIKLTIFIIIIVIYLFIYFLHALWRTQHIRKKHCLGNCFIFLKSF